jgi:hypothetical protein
MTLLLDSNILSSLGTDVLISLGTVIVSIVGGYIIIRERILKTEMKIEAMTNYIDRKNEVLDNKIRDLQADILDFKQINKESSNSLIENTAAIRELKVVLDLLKEQLGVKAIRKLKTTLSENDK